MGGKHGAPIPPPPHIVGIATVGLKSHRDRRNNASDAITLTSLSITQLTSHRIVQSAIWP